MPARRADYSEPDLAKRSRREFPRAGWGDQARLVRADRFTRRNRPELTSL